jgi:UDP-glucose 4-epimerase
VRSELPDVIARLYPGYAEIFSRRGWTMLPGIGRVYVNARAREQLGWAPAYDFGRALEDLAAGEDPRSPLALAVGAKGYHDRPTGVYTREGVT